MCAVESTDTHLLVQLPPSERRAFQGGLSSNFSAAMDSLILTQAEEADASNPQDVCDNTAVVACPYPPRHFCIAT